MRARPLLLLAATLALAAPHLVGSSAAHHPSTIACLVPGVLCPDLVVDASRFEPYLQTRVFDESHCDVQEGMVAAGQRTLLRFAFATPNVGAADLVVGSPQGNPHFEWSECHGHFHFKEYADYRLWEPAQYAAYDALRDASPGAQAHEILDAHPELRPLAGAKRGFCVMDAVQYEPTPPKFLTCSFQGISVGWADQYSHRIPGQYIDVTGVAPGTYVLEGEVNAEHAYAESDFDNNRGVQLVTL